VGLVTVNGGTVNVAGQLLVGGNSQGAAEAPGGG